MLLSIFLWMLNQPRLFCPCALFVNSSQFNSIFNSLIFFFIINFLILNFNYIFSTTLLTINIKTIPRGIYAAWELVIDLDLFVHVIKFVPIYCEINRNFSGLSGSFRALSVPKSRVVAIRYFLTLANLSSKNSSDACAPCENIVRYTV